MNSYINETFEEFFKKATSFSPYPYQQDLSCLEDIPDILNIPTGAGKTEASILAIYLWRILNSDEKIRQNTPRRLVYCLPMRVLVEQTVTRIEEWLKNLGLKDVKVITMMGGNVDRDYIMHPEENMIIIGTQDMLLSRALNRGYVASPYQWPRDFGLLNNDCLWIMDEIQLMCNGLVTSVQLEAFRNKMGTYGPHKTVWMSATVNPQWLDTIDFDSKKCSQFTLSDKDSKNKDLEKRNNAKKQLVKTDIMISKNDYTKNEIASIKEKHIDGTITLVIVNTVKRAQSIFRELKKSMNDDCMLVHSRFRKKERQNINKQLEELISSKVMKNMIIVSTQVVEAGLDISAKTMITEMAPWSSLVQRFGRCNRKGDYDDSKIHIIRLDEKAYNPYDVEDMIESEEKLEQKYGHSMSPNSLGSQKKEIIHESVIRESDIIGLFDTTPDMTGNHTDVSMYVRSFDVSLDVAVMWKNWDKKTTPPKYNISDEEICLVPKHEVEEFRKDNKIILWTYNIQNSSYEKATQIYPGQTLLIHCDSGGYDDKIGWDQKINESVKEQIKDELYNEEGNNDDPESSNMEWITLNDHTIHVVKEAQSIINSIYYLDKLKDTLLEVVKYHDVGKAHHIFQNTMVKNTDQDSIPRNEFWGKRGGSARHEIDNYRHEAFSALAILKIKEDLPNLELVVYLIASHHGKVRLSMRTMPTQRNMQIHDKRYLLGIDMECGGKVPIFLSDKWPKSKMSKEEIMREIGLPKEVDITVDIARVGNTKDGKHSWLQMTLKLLKEYGPFKLALLEAVIRAADTTASTKESTG